jgi:hypothetical protein
MDILAFPQGDKVTTAISIANSQGMTLRDYFAAKAMQALMPTNYIDSNAKVAYQMADAMLKAREQ